jgi:hypothetical protein
LVHAVIAPPRWIVPLTLALYVASDVAVLLHRDAHGHRPAERAVVVSGGCCHHDHSGCDQQVQVPEDSAPCQHDEGECTICRHGLIGGKLSLPGTASLHPEGPPVLVEQAAETFPCSSVASDYFSRGPPITC